MQQEPKKKTQIIAAAKNLFSKFGIKKVTVEEICQAAGASKMTFYKYFPNKKELAIRIFQEYIDRVWKKYYEIVEQEKNVADILMEISEYKLSLIDEMNDEFVLEFLQSDDPEISAFMTREQNKSMAAFRELLNQAGARGELRQDIKIELIEYLLNKIADFAQDEQLLGLYPDIKVLSREIMNFLLYGILTRKGKDEK